MAILVSAGPADVMAAVSFAKEHGLLVSIRGAGHNIAGNAVSDGGLMIDLSGLKSVRVDPEGRTARVEPGVTLGDLDGETQAFGLALPVGINSTTGVAGLTLGGGFGWLSRKRGLTIDSLLSADVVTADGRLVRASETENADLFWGLRGGGGNFGVVTSFEFRLHPVGPQVLSGLVVHPLADARDVLEHYREFCRSAPDELTVWAVLRQAAFDPLLTPHTEIFLAQMGGATSRVPKDATAYLHRDARFILNVHTRWEDAGDDERCVAWARSFFDAAAPHATGGAYVNFMPDDEGDRVATAYGDNYGRLLELKKRYDPDNLSRLNQNIRPA